VMVRIEHLPPTGRMKESPVDRAAGVAVVRDVTRQRELLEMKSDFVANVSHELRTPLASIQAYIEMLLDGEACDENTRDGFYRVIRDEADRLSRLIGNILHLSRIESGITRVQRQVVPLAPMLQDVIEIMRPQARAKGIQLRNPAKPISVRVLADPDLIHQVMVNLLSNAIKYTPANTPSRRACVSVSVDVDEAGRMALVSVSDTGQGIPPADLPHLFEKFYRVPEHKKIAPGSGLGLNLVKQVVQVVHGGTVTVVSEPQQGSTFTFSLPIAEEQAVDPELPERDTLG